MWKTVELSRKNYRERKPKLAVRPAVPIVAGELQYPAEQHMRPMQHIFARRDFLIRVSIFLIACLIGPAAFAATADDIGAAQSIIRAQEEAFARDDGATAYSF